VIVVAGANDINVWSGVTSSLSPGAYRNVHFYGGSTVTLGAGRYDMASLELEPDAQLILDVTAGPISINVEGPIQVGDRTTMSVVGGTAARVRFNTNHKAQSRIGSDAIVHGTFASPVGELRISPRARVFGTLRGNTVWIEPDAAVTCIPPSAGQ
jgi:hypothetical protein